MLSTASIATAVMVATAAAENPFNPFLFKQAASPGMDGWFKDAKLGMFMHWGPVSQWGTEISFPLMCTSFPCHPRGPNNTVMNITNAAELVTHRQAYADLATTFDPVHFNATDMARRAKRAGFKYLVYTTVHCDGFKNWDSKLDGYTIAKTPWGAKNRGTYSELVTAFRAEGLKVGAYVCPSLWNSDDYWAPNALSSPGPCCTPNYVPAAEAARWGRFTSYLHGMVDELTAQFQPDTFWFDCMNSPPMTDTHLEAVISTMRTANPDVVINIRNGMWSDYTESGDQSEYLANTVFGVAQEYVGDYFEIPAVMQSSRQWAYDPASEQKPTAEFLANLMMLTAKGGNYLMNVAPGPLGRWPASALQTLDELTEWFAINGEAIHNTRPAWPYQYGDLFVSGSQATKALYVLIPAMLPDHKAAASEKAPVPTGGIPRSSEQTMAPSGLHQALVTGENDSVALPWIRPSLFKTPVAKVELLGGSAPTSFTLSDADGMLVTGVSGAIPPPPPFDCSPFNCTCDGFGNYYGLGPSPGCLGFGCATTAQAQAWWVTTMNCTVSNYAHSAYHAGCLNGGCEAPAPAPVPASRNGLVIKISF